MLNGIPKTDSLVSIAALYGIGVVREIRNEVRDSPQNNTSDTTCRQKDVSAQSFTVMVNPEHQRRLNERPAKVGDSPNPLIPTLTPIMDKSYWYMS